MGFDQGGDLKGLLDRIDYIRGLGTTLDLGDAEFQEQGRTTGGRPIGGLPRVLRNLTEITRTTHIWGTNGNELRGLVDAAHARGMKVYFDIITNHTADVIGYQEGARTAYVPKDKKPINGCRHALRRPRLCRDWYLPATGLDAARHLPYTPTLDSDEANLKVPSWLNDVTLYHNRGNTTFVSEDSYYYGDFFGLDHLFTEHPRVVNGMIDIYKTWIGSTAIYGFRIDTMKHVNDEFWQKFGPKVLAYAKSQGKKEFFMFGEVFDLSRPFTSTFTTRNEMQAVLDFPFQDAARNFASKGAPASQLGTFFRNDDWYTDADSNVYQLPTFLSNYASTRLGSASS